MYLNYKKFEEHLNDNEWINNNFLDLFDETEETLTEKLKEIVLNKKDFDFEANKPLAALILAHILDPEIFNFKNKLELYNKFIEDEEFLKENILALAILM